MKTVTNLALASRRARQATMLSLLGLGILIIGLWLNFSSQPTWAYIGLVVGSVISWIGIALADRWVKPPRADRALEAALKGAGRAYALYNWRLPADHVLLAPWGLVVIVVSNVDSRVVVNGESWREDRPLWRKLLTIGRRPLGKPPALADLEVGALRRALDESEVADVPIEAVVVFTNPRVDLDINEPLPPALPASGLHDWLRRRKGVAGNLSSAKRRQLELKLDQLAAMDEKKTPPSQPAASQPAATRAAASQAVRSQAAASQREDAPEDS